MSQPSHRLNKLGVSPPILFSDPKDRFADTLLEWRAARLGDLRLGAFVRPVFKAANPLAERRIADDRDQVFNPATETLAVLDQPTTLLIALLDSLGSFAPQDSVLRFERGDLAG